MSSGSSPHAGRPELSAKVKRVSLTVTLRPSVRARLARLADANGDSLSRYVENLIRRARLPARVPGDT